MHPRAAALRRQIHDVLSGPLAYSLSLKEARSLDQLLRLELGVLLKFGDVSPGRAAELQARLVLLRAEAEYPVMPELAGAVGGAR
jgi:hypothetical protein